MLLVARVDSVDDPQVFLADAHAALAALATRPGWVSGTVGRALDDGSAFVVVCRWEDVGSGRRGLSTGAVRTQIMPLMARFPAEATTFEIVDDAPGPPSVQR
ncbi:MAG: antibiotic biosynthesis monooxygenase [Sporichthyaceae bacterium]